MAGGRGPPLSSSSMKDQMPLAGRAIIRLALLLACVPLAGCNPIFDVGGAFFPAWLGVVIGSSITVIFIRWILDRSGIEPFLGPRGLVYICMFVIFAIFYWLLFFQT